MGAVKRLLELDIKIGSFKGIKTYQEKNYLIVNIDTRCPKDISESENIENYLELTPDHFNINEDKDKFIKEYLNKLNECDMDKIIFDLLFKAYSNNKEGIIFISKEPSDIISHRYLLAYYLECYFFPKEMNIETEVNELKI